MPKISTDKLLADAADALDAGNVFPSAKYVDEHHLSEPESVYIAEKVADILRGYLALPKELRAAFDLAHRLNDEEAQRVLAASTPEGVVDRIWTAAFHQFFCRNLSNS